MEEESKVPAGMWGGHGAWCTVHSVDTWVLSARTFNEAAKHEGFTTGNKFIPEDHAYVLVVPLEMM